MPHRDIRWKGRAFLDSARNEVEKAVARGGLRVQSEVIRLVTQQSGPTRTNPAARPSLPGEPPHLRTGQLARSIDQETFRRGDEFTARVGTNLKKGFWLETGTRFMAPRPYLRPGLDNKRNQIVNEILKAGRRMK